MIKRLSIFLIALSAAIAIVACSTSSVVELTQESNMHLISEGSTAEKSNTLSDNVNPETNTRIGQASTEEATNAEVVLPEQTNTVGLTSAEGISIVFMGETITAPASYPGVPKAYIPVLDGLYLCGELSRRYYTLVYEDKFTQETLQEYDKAMNKINERGYTPYPYSGFERASGYALTDLDNDNIPELLILEDPSRYSNGKQTPSINSVFAIRNGQLVCIEKNSPDLQDYTILSANGTFYQCLDWRGIGYVDLSAFRLETGMTEFTVLSEARAALSFSSGDVPVPYWTKTVSGEETSITEKEFDTLLDQYKNPKEPIMLDYVPLHPVGAIELYSYRNPTDTTPIISIEYPSAYQGAPSEYKPVLDEFYLASVRISRGDSFDSINNHGELFFAELPHEELGYAVVDINSDGIPELLLGSIDGLTESTPNFVFTIKDGHPVQLNSFWSRSRGVIAADGVIYCVSSGGASYTYLSSYRLDKNADTLTMLTSMGSDYSQADEKPYYYQEVNGRIRYITEEEFLVFLEKYDNPSRMMELRPIPIA